MQTFSEDGWNSALNDSQDSPLYSDSVSRIEVSITRLVYEAIGNLPVTINLFAPFISGDSLLVVHRRRGVYMLTKL